MNSVGIDTFLNSSQKAAKGAAKSPAPNQANAASGEFSEYLREASTTAEPQQTTGTQPNVQPKRSGAAAASPNREQGSGNTADQEATETEELSQVSELPAETPPGEVEQDEVLLSVAADAFLELPDELVQDTAAPELTTTFQIDVVSVVAESEPTPGKDSAPTEQFLLPVESEPPVIDDTIVQTVSPEVAVDASSENDVGEKVVAADISVVKEVADSDDSAVRLPDAPTAATELKSDAVAENVQVAATDLTAKPQAAAAVNTAAAASAGDGKSALTAPELEEEPERVAAPEETRASETEEKRTIVEPILADVAEQLVGDKPQDTTVRPASDASAPTSLNHTSPNLQSASQASESNPAPIQADSSAVPEQSDSHMPTIDRARFVQRVANAFRSAQQNDGHIQLRLSPPELGSLRIEIAVRNGVLSANLETETTDARRVLLDNLPALRQRLAEQDIRIEKFDVDVRRDSGQSDGQTNAQDRQAQQQSQRAAAQNRIRTTQHTEVVSARVPRPYTASSDAGLDVRI